MSEIPSLSVTPNSSPVDFGSVVVGEVSSIEFTVSGIAFIIFIPEVSNIAIEQQSGQPAPSGEFGLSGLPAFPKQVTASTPFTFTVTFDPVDSGVENVDLVIYNNTPDPEIRIPLRGTGVAAGGGTVKAITVNPPNAVFPNTKTGETSAEVSFIVQNTGDANVEITGLTLSSDFTLSTGSFPQTITPGNTYTLGVVFNPTSLGVINLNATLAGDMDAGNYTINLLGTAFGITPAYTLDDGPPEVLVALFNGADAVVREFDHTDYDCEEDAYVEKTHMFPFYGAEGIPFPSSGYEKELSRVGLHYKDLGECAATVTLTAQGRGQSIAQALAFGTVGADNKIKWAWFDVKLVDELAEMRLERAADGGPLEISDYVVLYEPKGETIKV